MPFAIVIATGSLIVRLFAAVPSTVMLNVETKPTCRQQIAYARDLIHAAYLQEPRTQARYEAIFRAAGALEIAMLRWPATPEAAEAAEIQVQLYNEQFLFKNVITAVQHAEDRGLTNGERGP